jgi:hypothetical protein
MEADEVQTKSHSQPRHKRRWLLFIALMSLLAFGIGVLAALMLSKPGVIVPENVAKNVSFPIYLPARLPGNFKVAQGSFSFRDDALIFAAKDSSGASIVFAEQKRNPKFDFSSFYTSQMSDAETLSGTPFPSVIGKAKKSQTRLLSVVTDQTWVFVSTSSPLSQEDMQTIATGLKLSR